jgi:hypothetical protein
MSSETIACTNDLCECMVVATIDPAIGEPGDAYCGDACRNADGEGEACACGHPPCDA